MALYRVAYDVTQASPDWFFPAGGLLLLCLGVGFLRFHPAGSKFRGFSYAWVGFAALWTLVAAVGIFGGDRDAASTLTSGGAKVVEGVVENFHPMPAGGHDTERFTVEGVPFAYSDFILVPGFHNTSSHGGPVRAGLRVRIHYAGERHNILKLEIEDQPAK